MKWSSFWLMGLSLLGSDDILECDGCILYKVTKWIGFVLLLFNINVLLLKRTNTTLLDGSDQVDHGG